MSLLRCLQFTRNRRHTVGPSLFKKAWILPLVALVLWPFVGKAASAAFLSLDEYLSRIGESVSLIESGEGTLSEAQGRLLRDRFPLRQDVSKGQGEVFRVDNRILQRWIDGAEGSPGGRGDLLAHLKTLSEHLSSRRGGLPSVGLFQDKGRQTLEEVYNRDEFRHLKATDASPWKAYLAELLQRVLAWLSEHAGFLKGMPLAWISYAVYGLLILAGLLVMVWIVRSADRPGWRWRRSGIREAQTQGGEAASPAVRWTDLRADADSRAERGDLREAVRLFFVSVLLEGHSKGWWEYRPEATNREHLAFLGGPEERRDAFRKLTDLYERTWYGVKNPDRKAFAACREWLRRMEAA
jgi:hypothetical protein